MPSNSLFVGSFSVGAVGVTTAGALPGGAGGAVRATGLPAEVVPVDGAGVGFGTAAGGEVGFEVDWSLGFRDREAASFMVIPSVLTGLLICVRVQQQ